MTPYGDLAERLEGEADGAFEGVSFASDELLRQAAQALRGMGEALQQIANPGYFPTSDIARSADYEQSRADATRQIAAIASSALNPSRGGGK